MGSGVDGGSAHIQPLGWLGWALILAALFAWEGMSLARPDWGWPSMSDMFRAISTPVWGRWMLFAGWLWLGWHLFMRGWRFFLQGPPPGAPPVVPPGAGGVPAYLIRIGAPMLVLFALTLGLLVRFGRRRVRALRSAAAARQLQRAVTTVVPGFALFVAVDALLALGGIIHGTLLEAVQQGGLFTGAVVLPGWVVLSAGERVLARLRS